MRLDKLCSIEFRYVDAHFPKPYGDKSGPGWGIGDGTVSGERLSGTIKWSNHPSSRSDGVTLPDFRGVISTADSAKVLVSPLCQADVRHPPPRELLTPRAGMETP
jgi:hypothetical protein